MYAHSLVEPFSHASMHFSAAFAALPAGWQLAFAGLFGLAIGSFLNVVVHRLPIMLERAWRAEVNEANDVGEASVQPPIDDGMPARYNLWVPGSGCPQCGHALRAWENIPVLSYLVLRGRCSACRAPIGLRYPLIELASAAFAALSLLTFGSTGTALAAFVLCATLLATSAIDIDTRLLPDSLTQPLLWAGLIVNFGDTFVSLRTAVAGAIAGYAFLWCIYWLFKLVRGIEGMGYGDFKLLAALGAWLGWTALPQIILVSAVSGALVGLVATGFRRMRFEEPLPFGPFLAAGGVLTLFFGTPLFHVFGA